MVSRGWEEGSNSYGISIESDDRNLEVHSGGGCSTMKSILKSIEFASKKGEVSGVLYLSKRKTHHCFNLNVFAGSNAARLSLPLKQQELMTYS